MRIILHLFYLIPLLSFGQFNYQKGYIIKNNGDKIEGWIKKKNWTNSPLQISFKSSVDESSTFIKTINLNVLEIYDEVKYERFKVEIDLSSNSTSQITRNRDMDYETRSLLLKVLVESEKSLFMYKNNKIEKFFFRTTKKPITQLVYKKYTFNKGSAGVLGNDFITENKGYIRQLKGFIACSLDDKIKIPEYNRKALSKYFINNNNCSNEIVNSNDTKLISKETIGKVNFIFMLGVNSSKIEARVLGASTSANDLEYEQKLHPLLGLGVRYNTSNRKLSVVSNLSYNFSYKSENQTNAFSNNIDYSYLKLLFGGRYHILTGSNSSIFLGPYFFANYNLDGNILPQPSNSEGSITQTTFNIAFGIGFQSGRFEVDFKYALQDDPLRPQFDGSFDNLTFALAYSIFQ